MLFAHTKNQARGTVVVSARECRILSGHLYFYFDLFLDFEFGVDVALAVKIVTCNFVGQIGSEAVPFTLIMLQAVV